MTEEHKKDDKWQAARQAFREFGADLNAEFKTLHALIAALEARLERLEAPNA